MQVRNLHNYFALTKLNKKHAGSMFTIAVVGSATLYLKEEWDGLRSEVRQHCKSESDTNRTAHWNKAVDIVAERWYGIPFTCR